MNNGNTKNTLLRFSAFWLWALLLISFTYCTKPDKSYRFKGHLIDVKPSSSSYFDSSFAEFLAPYQLQIDSIMGAELCYLKQDLERKKPGSALTNLLSDWVYTAATTDSLGLYADFCMLNFYGFRRHLYKGMLTKGQVYELMPFDNEIVVLELQGRYVKELVSYIYKSGGEPVSGIQLTYHDSLVKECLIQGEEFSEDRSYRIVTSDYLANGGDGCDFFTKAKKVRYVNQKVRDVFLYNFRQKDTLKESDLSLESRIKFIGK